MALVRYKVLEAEVKDGTASLPEKAVLLGPWVNAKGATTIAFMMTYIDWVAEFPNEAAAEAKAEAQQKGNANAE